MVPRPRLVLLPGLGMMRATPRSFRHGRCGRSRRGTVPPTPRREWMHLDGPPTDLYNHAMATARRLTAAVTREDEWFVAQCLEVEVASQGKTVEEALANLKEALELVFEDDPNVIVHPTPIIAPIDLTA